MKLKIYLTIILSILIIPISSFAAFTGMDYHTWYGTTGDDVVLLWDNPGFQTASDTFEIQIRNPERNIIVNIPSTSTLTKTFKCPKTGHWIVSVRVKRIVSDQPLPLYSIWADSTDPVAATVNGQPRGWWIFTWIAGTGPIVKEEIQTGNHKNTLVFNNLNEMGKFFASILGGK